MEENRDGLASFFSHPEEPVNGISVTRGAEEVSRGGIPTGRTYSLSLTIEDTERGRALIAEIDAALERAPSPAPAWACKAPKAGDGWYWTRASSDDDGVEPLRSIGGRWLDAFWDEAPRDASVREHWPIPIQEPPK